MIKRAAEPKAHFKFNGIVGYFVIFYSIFAPSRYKEPQKQITKFRITEQRRLHWVTTFGAAAVIHAANVYSTLIKSKSFRFHFVWIHFYLLFVTALNDDSERWWQYRELVFRHEKKIQQGMVLTKRSGTYTHEFSYLSQLGQWILFFIRHLLFTTFSR